MNWIVRCRIDGHPYALMVSAESATDAVGVIQTHHDNRQTVTYPTFEGKVIVRWDGVVVLEITVVSPG